MKGLVLRGGGAALEDRPIPQPGPTEVVVRTTVASICSADVAPTGGTYSASGDTHPENACTAVDDHRDGLVVGHEAVGLVHATGAMVHGFSVGDRVASMSTTPCGSCLNCQRGHGGHCGGGSWGGYTAGVTRDGTLAEYYVVPNADYNLAFIPDDLSDAGALLVTDTLASGSSWIETARLPLGAIVVVFGVGHVGLAALLTARLRGAAAVIAVKSRPGGEQLAYQLGADHVFNTTQHDIEREIFAVSAGMGADCTVEASGAPSAFALAVAVTRLGGDISVLATYESANHLETLPIPLADWGWGIGDKTILPTFQVTGSERLSRLMRLVAGGRADPSVFFTHRYPFHEAPQAFMDVGDRVPGLVKPLIEFAPCR